MGSSTHINIDIDISLRHFPRFLDMLAAD